MTLAFRPAVMLHGRSKSRIHRHYGAAGPFHQEGEGGPTYRPYTRPMIMPQSTALILDAAAFAATCYTDQRRTHAGDVPAVNHAINVAREIATTAGVDNASVLAAALLHDVIEDTDITADQLAERFGASVAEMVAECSDDPDLKRKERKAAQIEQAPNISPGAKLIKLADKLCNIREIHGADDGEWSLKKRQRYLEWADEVVTALGKVNESLERAYWTESKETAALIGPSPKKVSKADKKANKKARKEEKAAKRAAEEEAESVLATATLEPVESGR